MFQFHSHNKLKSRQISSVSFAPSAWRKGCLNIFGFTVTEDCISEYIQCCLLMTKRLNLYLAIFSAQFLWECHRRHMRSDLLREEWASALQCMARQWHLKNKYNSLPWWFTMPFTVTEQEDKGEKKNCIQCYNELCFLIFVDMERSCYIYAWGRLSKRDLMWSFFVAYSTV